MQLYVLRSLPIPSVTSRISATRIAGSGGWLLCTSVLTSIYLKFSFFQAYLHDVGEGDHAGHPGQPHYRPRRPLIQVGQLKHFKRLC